MGGRLHLQRMTPGLVPHSFRPRKPASAWPAPALPPHLWTAYFTNLLSRQGVRWSVGSTCREHAQIAAPRM